MRAPRVFTSLYVITVMVSLFYLTYTSFVYFDVYTLARRSYVSAQYSRLELKDSDTIVETTFILQNPSKLELKVSYIKQEIYQYSNYKGLLGESFVRKDYIIRVPPFSNGTVTVQTLLENFLPEDSNVNLFLIVHVRVEDVPVINYFHLKEYFALSYQLPPQ